MKLFAVLKIINVSWLIFKVLREHRSFSTSKNAFFLALSKCMTFPNGFRSSFRNININRRNNYYYRAVREQVSFAARH